MAAPFFSYLNYKNSDYGQNNGYIENIEVTSDTGNLLSISWAGPNGYTSGPSSVPLPDLTNLEPGTYTGTVLDSVTLETGTVEIEIESLPQVLLNVVFDNTCIGTINCDCVLDVLDFTHNSDSFKYDLYRNGVLIDTYYGTTGNEAFQFTGLCDGEYFLVATETDQTVYTYDNRYDCIEGSVIITPADILSSWTRFCFYAPIQPVTGQYVQLDEITGKPVSNVQFFDAPTNLRPNYFWDSVSNPYRIAPQAGPADGVNTGPTAVVNQWYRNTTTGNYNILTTSGWTTYNPTQDRQGELPTQGNPTAYESYTGTPQWGLSPITLGQISINSSGIVIPAPAGDMVECYLNSDYFNGFYSNCGYYNYTHEVTVGSTDDDEDEIGIVLGSFKDINGLYGPKDFTHTLTFKNYNGNGQFPSTFGIYYNIGNGVEGFKDPNDISITSPVVIDNNQNKGVLQPGTYFIQSYEVGDDFSNLIWSNFNDVPQPVGAPPINTYFKILTAQTPTTWTEGTKVRRRSPFTFGTSILGNKMTVAGYCRFRIIRTKTATTDIITIEATSGMSPNKGLASLKFLTIPNSGYTDGTYVIPVPSSFPPIDHVPGSIQIIVVGGTITSNNITILSTGENYYQPGNTGTVVVDITPYIPHNGIGTVATLTMQSMNGDKVPGDNNPYELFFTLDLLDTSTWLTAPDYAVDPQNTDNTKALEKFSKEPSRIGYLTASQPKTKFFDISFSGEQSNTTSNIADELGASDNFISSEPCGCPEGFTYNIDTEECDIEIEESIICNRLTYTIEKTPENIEYSAQGAYFYEDTSNKPLPLTRSQTISGGTTQGTRIVKDGIGNVLQVERIVQNLVWGRTFNYNPAIVTFSPTPVDTGLNATNLAQIAANGLTSTGGWLTPVDLGTNGYGGRLNAAGIWTNVIDDTDQLPLDEWIGFSTCVVALTTQKYCVGISGDDKFRFKVDGQLYFDFSLASADGQQRWHVVELELTAGNHIFEFEGLNTGGSAALAVEIYNASSATLQAVTTIGQLEALIEWSTLSLIGNEFDSGEESGCHCPSGYALSSCDAELKCVRYESVPYVKCNCYKAINCEDREDFFYFTIDSLLPPLDLTLIYTFNDPAGRSKSNEFSTKACYRIEDSIECDVLNANLAVADTFEDCDTCSGTCFKLTDCTNPETFIYIDRTTKLELTEYIGKVISIYFEDLDASYCATVETIPCNQAVNPVTELPFGGIITGDFCDCEECLPKPIQIPVIEINNRTVKPGYNTVGCSVEYVEKISCDYGEALYQEVVSRRYGLAFCCAKDLNKLDIKKQLMDFKMITNPDACKAVTSDCCPPCNLEVELNVIQTQECLPPISIQVDLVIP